MKNRGKTVPAEGTASSRLNARPRLNEGSLKGVSSWEAAEGFEESVRGGPRARGWGISFHLLIRKCQDAFICLLIANLCVWGRGEGWGGVEGVRESQVKSQTPGKQILGGVRQLPQSWSSPTQSLPCTELTYSLTGEGGREGGEGLPGISMGSFSFQ